MKRTKERIEALSEIFNDNSIQATEQQIKQIVEDFSNHIEMESEMDSYQHVGHKEVCKNCQSLESKLKSITRERDVYHKSVCKRRGTEDVWIEGDSVMFK